MLLALWFDFWNPNSWHPGPPQIVVQPEGDGGSKGRLRDEQQYKQVPAIPDRADESFWREREIFLRRHLPIVAPAESEIHPEVKKLVRKHNRLIELAPRATAKDLLRT